MKNKSIFKQLLSAAFAASLTLVISAGGSVQAAPTKAEINEILEVRILAESGWTYPSIEEILTARKMAAAQTDKIQSAQAK